MTGTKPAKRPPGRPSHKPKPQPIPVTGVSAEARDPDKLVELVIDAPDELKRMFKLFAALDATNICVEFGPAAVSFYAAVNKTRVVARIDGARANHYYCGAPGGIKCAITRSKYDRIFAVPDAGVHATELHILRGAEKVLDITYVNSTLGRRCAYSIALSNFDAATEADAELAAAMDADVTFVADEAALQARYPLEWRLEAGHFKRMVNTNKLFAKTVSVRKLAGAPLSLQYQIVNGHDYAEEYVDGSKIGLRVNEEQAGQFFQVDLSLARVAPLASSSAIPHVRVLCATDAPTLYRSAPPPVEKKDAPASSAAFMVNVLVAIPVRGDDDYQYDRDS